MGNALASGAGWHPRDGEGERVTGRGGLISPEARDGDPLFSAQRPGRRFCTSPFGGGGLLDNRPPVPSFFQGVSKVARPAEMVRDRIFRYRFPGW